MNSPQYQMITEVMASKPPSKIQQLNAKIKPAQLSRREVLLNRLSQVNQDLAIEE